MIETRVVYKVCSRAAWLAAQRNGELLPSSADQRDGFTHLSAAHQLGGTLAKHFAGQADLVLLAIPVEHLPEGILRWEISRGGEHFPHLYAALRTEWVGSVTALEADPDGNAKPPRDL